MSTLSTIRIEQLLLNGDLVHYFSNLIKTNINTTPTEMRIEQGWWKKPTHPVF